MLLHLYANADALHAKGLSNWALYPAKLGGMWLCGMMPKLSVKRLLYAIRSKASDMDCRTFGDATELLWSMLYHNQ